MTAPVVTLRGVRKAFPTGTLALDGLNLTVNRGEFLSLVGPSGCGKSTALRLIAGLAKPSAGAVVWGDDGAGPARAPAPGDLGVVFQEPTLMPWTTVAGNVRLPLRLTRRRDTHRGDDAEARVAAAIARVGLDGFADAYPRELSGGMKMRAAIARALVTDPHLLLMDEPFAALDEITRFRLDNALSGLWQGLGTTVVFVTHSVFEAVYLSTRIVVMTPRPGRVAADIAIDAPFPRGETFRTSPEFASLCRTVGGALAEAMGEAFA
ncbi:nitrate/sulfonate/bicarbonate ABC transporter ATP-binding protein [Rhodoplanes elegans]|uniref:Nitrate/sulfonate/bicarbonate ABC transporter ATP-binding protein n=1 Tax=Rhodoplanes elegans TaxID=29408 RepID=A0A327K2W6_9BRAD|nr:ABC transporter ATP-binding protein [Rhodoplanes elegans]MBK5958654.1 nitrate/sulfonate/bicarbonate ABC transporter ATP-binding protein [Rhodoplanes elegans]RAI32136.1 nitrate/sulfonate/bicarbonate ABC transporter ATP-binding protein [Rhodoplanes elegans]